MFGRGRRTAAADDATVYLAAARLIGYPDEELLADLPHLRAALVEAGGNAALEQLIDVLEAGDALDLQQEYVRTFDLRRRASLYLTYYSHGDTRKRGMALLETKQTYAAHGMELVDGELPDHLAVILAFAGHASLEAGRELLITHRPGLELLRLSLEESRSPWALAVGAVSATLSEVVGDQREIVQRLLAAGPPDEGVGLDPYSVPLVAPDAPSGATFAPSGVPAGAPAEPVFFDIGDMMSRTRKG